MHKQRLTFLHSNSSGFEGVNVLLILLMATSKPCQRAYLHCLLYLRRRKEVMLCFRYVCLSVCLSARGGSSPKILGALPHQPLYHRVHFLRSPKSKKYELHIGLHLKSIISRVANYVMRWTPRPVGVGWGSWQGPASLLPIS